MLYLLLMGTMRHLCNFKIAFGRTAESITSQYQISFLLSFLLFFQCFPHLQGSKRILNLVHHKKEYFESGHRGYFLLLYPLQNGSGWKGPQGVIWPNLPVQARPSQSTWHGIESKWFLNISNGGDSSTSLGIFFSVWLPAQ